LRCYNERQDQYEVYIEIIASVYYVRKRILERFGLDVLNPVQPECMDLAKLRKLYGDQLASWGTSGLAIAPTHVLAPEVPIENIAAFVEAVKEYGGLKNW
jgi:hypothetical protein